MSLGSNNSSQNRDKTKLKILVSVATRFGHCSTMWANNVYFTIMIIESRSLSKNIAPFDLCIEVVKSCYIDY